MKITLTLIGLMLAASLHGQTTNRIALTGDNHPAFGTNTDFHVFSTTNIALPVSQWEHVTNVNFVTATNSARKGEGWQIEIWAAEDRLRFYAVAPSNFTGRASFSEPASVRRLPTGTGLRIGAW